MAPETFQYFIQYDQHKDDQELGTVGTPSSMASENFQHLEKKSLGNSVSCDFSCKIWRLFSGGSTAFPTPKIPADKRWSLPGFDKNNDGTGGFIAFLADKQTSHRQFNDTDNASKRPTCSTSELLETFPRMSSSDYKDQMIKAIESTHSNKEISPLWEDRWGSLVLFPTARKHKSLILALATFSPLRKLPKNNLF